MRQPAVPDYALDKIMNKLRILKVP